MINRAKKFLAENKSFSHSVARHRRRRIKRVFAGGISANFSRWKIAIIRAKSIWDFIRNLFRSKQPGGLTGQSTPKAPKFDHRMDSHRYLTMDTKHRTQHRK